MDLKPFHRTNY